MFTLKTLLVFVSIIICQCYSYKILMISKIPTGSHYILASKLVKEIGKAGHEVTFITPYPGRTTMKNVKEIGIESLQNILSEDRLPNLETSTPFDKAKAIMGFQYDFTEHVISNEKIQNLMKSEERFDAVILYQYFNDALLGLAYHFKAPVILFSSMPLYVSESFLLSHPNPSSYVPNILTEYTGRMNFWQRLRNTYYDVCMILYYQWYILPKHRELVKKYIPGQPELYEFLNNASILLINSHVSTNEAIPMVPNAIEIGGYHVDDPKPLPEDLKKFLDGSKNGAILFSMGSIWPSAGFPKEKQEAIIKAFSKLKENVLWKFEDDKLPNLPQNVKVSKWLPQSDVLAHPNVKLFVSHGGLLSTTEAVYHGVPIVGIPLSVDQHMNIAFAVANEFAVQVPFTSLTEETLSQGINEVLTNPKYKKNIQRRSKILHDRPIKPMENALYWIEYVIRHDGAKHLRYPGMDLNWFQRNLIDVAAFVVIVGVSVIVIVSKIVKATFKRSGKHKKE